MAQGLYLGKAVDSATGALGTRVELDSTDLLTHGVIVGMTGSGKTGLAVALIEEVLRKGIPVLAIDPKGDLGNLLLLFDHFDAKSFLPWIDADVARRAGKSVEVTAQETADAWRKGLQAFDLTEADAAALALAREAVVFTPGSRAGVPLDILQSLEAPGRSFDEAADDLREDIAGIVAGLLGLLHIEADPLQSQEGIFLANLIEASWRKGKGLSLEALVAAIAEPPFDKVGALPLESVYPRAQRQRLMLALNNLLASPGFAVWREGEPMDIDSMLWAPDRRPRLSIVYTAHLAEEERLFVTALLLDRVKGWTRRQPGTTALRALLYMDEVFGYFPPHPKNPPTKPPLLTLLKQARAQGLGVVLATQNPVDLDYKALANMGTWLVGTLQTAQDRERLMEGLTGSGLEPARIANLLDATRKRVFLLHDVHREAPCLLHSRWALSYLRGPLTREDISRLMAARRGQTPTPDPTGQPAPRPNSATSPAVLPAPFRSHYLNRYGGELAEAYLMVKYAVRYKGLAEDVVMRAWPLTSANVTELLETDAVEVDEAALVTEAPAGVRLSDVPAVLGAGAQAVEKALKARLPDKLAVTIYVDPATKSRSHPGESREAFAGRLDVEAGGASAEALRERLEKKQRDLAAGRTQLSGRAQEKWTTAGQVALQNVVGFLVGRKRTVTGVSSVLAKNRMENAAEAKVAALEAEVASLEEELGRLGSVDVARFESEEVMPPKGGVKLLRYDILWVF